MKIRFVLLLIGFTACFAAFAAENDVGFVEKFALAADREAVLQELVPGSEEYYFYHALQDQNTRNTAKLRELMAQWAKTFPDSPQRRTIENREALLNYDADPKGTLQYLRDRLHLEFHSEREVHDQPPDLPTALDQKLIGRDVFTKAALNDSDELSKCKEGALELFLRDKVPLNPAQRRILLSKLERPDLPGVVDLVTEELDSKESQGFGALELHEALLPDQLDELAARNPALYDDEKFVETRLRKLAPGADADGRFDPAERTAWLDRLWAYAKNLSPTANTVKAQILYQRLLHDRTRGIYDRARFLEYLALPREAAYVRPEYLKREGAAESAADLKAEPGELFPGAEAIGDDEWLVREFLLHFFKSENAWQPWAVYLRDSYLKPIFAEAKIVNGIGDAQQWAAFLTPSAFQELKDRVDLDFSPTNPTSHLPGDAVSLEMFVKNAPKLIVKIYELDTLGFFLTQNRELNTDIQLDGLVANVERTQEFHDPPLRRVERKFEFPELKGRGAWIVEFVGGGKSSRALIRKGQWSMLQQIGPAGDMITVLDEDRQPVADAAVWLDGRKYTVEAKTGRILAPFTEQPGNQSIILANAAGSFATLTSFEHHQEEYRLDAQFHLAREQLIAGREATLGIRPTLILSNEAMAPGLLREPRLTITATSLDGISTTTETKDLHFEPAQLFTHSFIVPERLANVTVKLSAKVERLGSGQEEELTASQTWDVNGIDKTIDTSDGHFARIGDRIVFEMLGKNGEAVPNRQVRFKFTHRDFTNEVEAPLRTDERGRIDLGPLLEIEKALADMNNGRIAWYVPGEDAIFPKTFHVSPGDPVEVPWLGSAKLTPFDASLLEMRSGTPAANRFDALKVEKGMLTAGGLAPGDYRLLLRGAQDDEILVRVTAGRPVAGWLVGPNRVLEQRNLPPVHIESLDVHAGGVVVQLRNSNPYTRVHVAATRFTPEGTLEEQLGGFQRFEPSAEIPAKDPNVFVSGRKIGDEYRYILDRRYARKFPGNMLSRPGLLLDPWEIRSTESSTQSVAAGEAAAAGGGGRNKERMEAAKPGAEPEAAGLNAKIGGPSLEFLASPAPVLYNLAPDAQGIVRIDRKLLGDRQGVSVYAEDLASSELREIGLPEQPTKFQDLALAHALDPKKHFMEKKEASVLVAGQTLALEDVRTADLQSYDTLGAVHALFVTLTKDGNLEKFAWLLDWPRLKDDEKRAKYSEFACHELNFFLSRKDPAFFRTTVQPFLRNKKDKTFLDEWLLEADLKRYLEPWEYARLNVVEQALLAQRTPGETAPTARHVRESWETIPPNLEKADALFETALHRKAMEADELDEAKKVSDLSAAATPLDLPAATLEVKPSVARGVILENSGGVTSSAAARKEAKSDDAIQSLPFAGSLRTGVKAITENAIDALLAGTTGAAAGSPAVAAIAGVFTDPNFKVTVHALDRNASSSNRLSFDSALAGELRGEVRQYYRKIGPTMEWAENNYYRVPIARQTADLIPVNAFWRDYAAWDGKSPFLSPHFPEASGNFSEMLMALAVLDLPFDAPRHITAAAEGKYVLTAGGPLVAFRKEIRPAPEAGADGKAGAELLVSEHFFRESDRYTEEGGNEKAEKYVTGEFLAGVAYGATVVATNPAASTQKVELLIQIPQGALPLLGTRPIECKRLRLEPYAGEKFEYHFYFPRPAADPLPHYPVQASADGIFAAAAKPTAFTVVQRFTQTDKTAWDYVSQEADENTVLTYLESHNLAKVDLERIAWRARQSADFFRKLVDALARRHVYSDVVYRHAVLHGDLPALREWLRHEDEFVSQCGPILATKLLTIDPIERHAYEHLEYSPLVNQRIHRLGAENAVSNGVVRGQYQSLLQILAHEPKLTPMDEMSVVYHLFLQDRVEEALARLATIPPDALSTRLQYDYLRCYAAFCEEKPAAARDLAAQYADYPVDRWRKLFANVVSQADEIEGNAPAPGKAGAKPDREEQQSALANTEPTFDLKVENRTVTLGWKNLREVTINYYPMDPEFLFSSSPFVSEDSARFSVIKPARTDVRSLPEDRDSMEIPLPGEFAKSNVLVEVLGAGQRKAQACHANAMKLILIENYGRLELRDEATNKPLGKAYVKVYARLRGGAVRFYKDGYTDLRGKFDYASLNTGDSHGASAAEPAADAGTQASLDNQMLRPSELGAVEKLAVLVLSESNGAAVREVGPPSQ